VQWLYVGRIQALNTLDLEEFLIEAWCCGERLQAREFRNVVINMLFFDWEDDESGNPEGLAIAKLAYEKSLPDSALRLLIIDKFTAHAREDMLQGVTEDLPSALLADLTLRFLAAAAKATKARIVRSRAKLKYDVCQRYHDHEDKSLKCSEAGIQASFYILPAERPIEHIPMAPFQEYEPANMMTPGTIDEDSD